MLTELGLVSYQGKNQETHDLLHEKLGFPVYVPPKLEEMKFYMPLTVETCYEENGYGGYEQQSEMFEISPYVLLGCEDLLNEKLMDYADRKELGTSFQERGLMAFYMDNDSIAHKVEEFNFSFEEIEGEMYGVAVCQVDGKLSSEEFSDLKNFITAQAADGLGEGFEQQDIKVGEIEVSVSLWNSYDWELKTAEEMGFQEQDFTGMGGIQ